MVEQHSYSLIDQVDGRLEGTRTTGSSWNGVVAVTEHVRRVEETEFGVWTLANNLHGYNTL